MAVHDINVDPRAHLRTGQVLASAPFVVERIPAKLLPGKPFRIATWS